MNDNAGETAAHDAELSEQWTRLEAGLAAYLILMTDPDEEDHLILEVPNPYADDEGCAPYAQFAAFGSGQMIRAEISGNRYLQAYHRLDSAGCEALRSAGWQGHDIGAMNWFMEVPIVEADELAHEVTAALQHHFGVAHPQLLTHQAWGPAAEHVAVLGLLASDEVPEELSDDGEATKVVMAVIPDGPDHLHTLIADVLRAKFDEEPTVDDDDDFLLVHDGQPVYVRSRQEQPAVEIVARVAHGVHSRRAAAVELAILNRTNSWVSWELHERDVFLTMLIPARPFVAQHLDELLDVFLSALSETREDLALRLRAAEG